ncbi:MAG: hypothetical protein Ct9H300mP19_16810 [Dehalococcoidia bacterium]|nr:MAG: hypothetical protein Ct9H300mP19_16810 [Dehalococcoidia bacterium]
MATHQDLMMLRYANILPTVQTDLWAWYGPGNGNFARAWQPSGN